MRRWIFQANPKHFDILGALAVLDEIRWRVPQYTDEVRPGDEVVIWRSGSESGIVGVGTWWLVIQANRRFRRRRALSSSIKETEGNPETRVLLKVRPVDHVPKAVLQQQESLREHQIIRAPMGTVFRLETPEWTRSRRSSQPNPPPFDGVLERATRCTPAIRLEGSTEGHLSTSRGQ